MELFAKIVKKGLTFNTPKGPLLPQQVWQLPLTGNNGFNLDEISKTLLKKVRESEEESLVTEASSMNTDDQLRLDVLKCIIADKKAEKEAREKAAATRAKNNRIKELIAKKQDQELEEKSLEELEALLSGE